MAKVSSLLTAGPKVEAFPHLVRLRLCILAESHLWRVVILLWFRGLLGCSRQLHLSWFYFIILRVERFSLTKHCHDRQLSLLCLRRLATEINY